MPKLVEDDAHRLNLFVWRRREAGKRSERTRGARGSLRCVRVLECVSRLNLRASLAWPNRSWSDRNRWGSNWAQERGGAASFVWETQRTMKSVRHSGRAFQTLAGETETFSSAWWYYSLFQIRRWGDLLRACLKLDTFVLGSIVDKGWLKDCLSSQIHLNQLKWNTKLLREL